MAETLKATTFKHSHQSFLETLDSEGIKYNRHIQLGDGPVAAGITIDIIITGGWGTLAVACIAWASVRKSRKICITTKDNEVVWLQGYSAKEAERILPEAKNMSVIDTQAEQDEP